MNNIAVFGVEVAPALTGTLIALATVVLVMVLSLWNELNSKKQAKSDIYAKQSGYYGIGGLLSLGVLTPFLSGTIGGIGSLVGTIIAGTLFGLCFASLMMTFHVGAVKKIIK